MPTTATASATTPASSSRSTVSASSSGPAISKDTRFKPDFQRWLQSHGYGDYDFAKNPNSLPSFGGRSRSNEKLTRQPVILIHGNADTAAGWNQAVADYKKAGYKDSEIYVMSWGDGKVSSAGNNYHSEHYLREVRGFIQAVKDYTGADKVDVVGHSMGVTLARKAIKGGTGDDQASPGGTYDLGKPISDEVDTFVGIAGGNKGLLSCDLFRGTNPTCSPVNGFTTDSKFLADLNADPTREGDHVYSIYSMADPILSWNDSLRTAPVPREDGEQVYFYLGHLQSRDLSGDVQVRMVQDHQLSDSTTIGWPFWPSDSIARPATASDWDRAARPEEP
ncbi:MAG TPA: alpha/beta fold hydrolase [Myxococcales bacterium]|nr:alpha/beta fold hydrolase [Myxococcales bacterium]